MLQRTADSLDEALLARLLGELGAEAGEYRFEVAPNPCVGAAVLAQGQIVARGHHELWGGPHAEIVALGRAAQTAVSATEWDLLVVTLEPCSSRGKTGPCVDAILASGIPRVVVGALDPDPRHRGVGLEKLRDAGVEVYLMEGHTPIEAVAPYFQRWNLPERLRRPRPWTVAKWAQTRTGQLQPPKDVGEGRWISSADSRAEVLTLRSRVDAVVTGVGTVLADDPRLTVRAPASTATPPLRVVLDSFLRTPPDSRLLAAPAAEEDGGAVLILTLAGAEATRWRALEKAGAEVVGLRTDDGDRVSLREVQTHLWDRGIRRLLLESGPTLLESYLEREYVDQLRIYTGDVNGGLGASMGIWLAETKIEERLDRESGSDAVLEGFLG
jgi:diaminohydroxyphosphoribosylaminopyrimidine deaminase/5-amino-6-(5-phosphoribosylamino)uracil reductase